jgi:hypothetical protein
MTITLDIPGDVAQRLAVQASRLGLSIDQFVLRASLGQLESLPTTGAFGTPTYDPLLSAAATRASAAARELNALGIADDRGNRLRTDLPEDMREGADRDFGG